MSDVVNRGSELNDPTADTIYDAFGKVNDEFAGLGDASTKDVGTGAGDVAAGNHGHDNAVPTGAGEKDGFMSKEDKAKLDGVANNANAYTLPVAGAALGGVKADTKGEGDTVEAKLDTSTEKLFVPTYPTVPVKATGAEINTGTDDAKFVTSKAIADSNIAFALTVGREITDATANFATSDVNTMVKANRSTAQTFTIPHTTFALNNIITVIQLGAGIVTIAVGDGAKQTINTAKKTWGADSVIQIICIDATANAEIWKVIGGTI
jgi:hypothetical protein